MAATSAPALDVYLTVDVEVWCDGWERLDEKFPRCFREYIHGQTSSGSYGVGFQAALLRAHGLAATFFVEPLFALRFGEQYLCDAVGPLLEHSQDVQLHLHTEWVDEARSARLPPLTAKKQYLRQFGVGDQASMIATGAELLQQAGAAKPRAFRAGSFGFNSNTLLALSRNDIEIDCSYNATMFGPTSGVSPGTILTDSTMVGDVYEVPMTVFVDGRRRLRHAQLTACSWAELELLLWQARSAGQGSFTLLSHSAELLAPGRQRVDRVVLTRLERLCRLLADHPQEFRLRTFSAGFPRVAASQPAPLRGNLVTTASRVFEQVVLRRLH